MADGGEIGTRGRARAALRRVAGHALRWGQRADADGPSRELVDEEERALDPLDPLERLLYMALVGPAGSLGADAGEGFVALRTSALEAGELLVDHVLAGGMSEGVALDRLWRDATQGRGAPAWLGAVALGLVGRLPLSVDGVDALRDVSDPAIAALVGFALGRAAWAGDAGAWSWGRTLAGTSAGSELVLGWVKGLGEGSLRAGVARCVARAARSPFEAAEWAAACRGVAMVALHAGAEVAVPAVEAGLAASTHRDEALDFLRTALAAAGPAERPALLDALGKDWGRLASPARAALVVLLPDLGALPAARLFGERSTAVLRAALEALEGGAPCFEPEEERRLYRTWANHEDVAVRRSVARRLLGAAPHEPHVAAEDGVAELVALPPAALVRGPLDRLRAALWQGDSEVLAEITPDIPEAERPQAREALLSCLEVPNAALRRACIEAIGRIGAVEDGPRLVAAARAYRALEGTVAAALRALGAQAQADALAELYHRRLKWADDDAVDDYCALAGAERVMHLLAALDTRFYPGARAGAARAMARAGAHEVIFALRSRGLSDPHEAAREAALQALHELSGASPSPEELAGHALLVGPSEELGEAVDRVRAVGRGALPGLRRTLAKGSWRRRQAACEALAGVAGREAEEGLLDALVDPDEDVRMTAMEALFERGWAPRTPRERTLATIAARRPWGLLEAPQDVDPEALREALSLGGLAFRAELAEVVAQLRPAGGLGEAEAPLRVALLDVDGALELPGGLAALFRAIDHTWQALPHRAHLARALHGLEPSLLAAELAGGGWDWRVREALCRALARPGDDTGVAALAACTLDDDEDVRRAALEGLAAVATESAAAAIARGFESPFQEFRELAALALAAVGEAAWPALRRLERDPWWEGRQGAAMTLRAWRRDRQEAADRLVVLAMDGEYRVSQPAREGLAAHGIMPRRAAIREAVERAQLMTVEGMEGWVGVDIAQDTDPDIAGWLDGMVEWASADALPHRLGLIPLFRVAHLAGWLEDAALGRTTRHVGVRLAAADALRALVQRHCTVCHGEGAVRCPECGGAGDRPCARCLGQTLVLVPCPEPECTARQLMRKIDSRRCPTCRGRGEVASPCECSATGGRVVCELCRGRGRIGCVACEGTGASPGAGPR